MHVDLDLTSDCNFRCRHCGDLARGLLNHGGLPRNIIEALLDDLQTLAVYEVALIGGGEPTVSAHFADTVRGLHERGIRCGVVTNGSCISDAALAAMQKGCEWVRVSLDAATEDTYRKVHKPKGDVGFANVAENIERMIAAMGRRVGVSFLITALNAHEIHAATQLAKAWGAAYMRIRPMQHPRTGRPVILPRLDQLNNQLASAAACGDEQFVVSLGDAIGDLGGASLQPKDYRSCHAQAFGATIAGDGRVYVCSKWRGEVWACVGDLKYERFTALWNGPRRKAVLDVLSPAVACTHVYCHAHPLNLMLSRRLPTPTRL